jgi:transcriptional regulator with XRE-family HTH domain
MPGSSIRTNRESKNYTQEYVAKQMGISQNAYSKIENGYTQLTVSHLKEISRVLEVSWIDLLKDDFEIHKPNHIRNESITKDNLLMLLDNLKEKLNNKHPLKHEIYPVIMSLLQTVDTTIEDVY